MPFNNKRYNRLKKICEDDLAMEFKTAKEYMQIYKDAIIGQDYEAAKAIAEILEPLGYHVTDTHRHIEGL